MSDQKKIKVVAYCDSPTCATGFGTVSRNIFEPLYMTGRYDIDILGINYWGDPHNFPYRIWPTGTNQQRDPYGRLKCFQMIQQMEFDLLFFLQDTFILDMLPPLHEKLREAGRKFKSICYFPIDGKPKEKWLENVTVVDYPVTYSEWGKGQVLSVKPDFNENLITIPHGANIKDFFVAEKHQVNGFRSQYFGAHADKFIITNVNRNQQRKDIPRTLVAFKEFRKQVPDSILYLHMAKQDQGWDLEEVCKGMGLSTTDDVLFPENFGPNQGFPRQIVNLIYNASDLVVSTTLGEGWGLAWTEAMATKTPVLMPDNTALTEVITEDKGYLVNSGSNPSLHTVVPNDNEVLRPLVDVEHMVETMLHIYNNYDEAKKKAEKAYDWIMTKMDWHGDIAQRWLDVFDKAATEKDSLIEVPDFGNADEGVFDAPSIESEAL